MIELFLRRLAGVVHIDDVRRLLEGLPYALRDLQLARIIEAVDLGDERRQHRRAGRHLDDFHVGAEAPADLLQRLAHGCGDLMRLALAQVLVEQVDLDVALVRGAPQVVLTHEAVEIDRSGSASVDLVVGDFRDRRDGIRQRLKHALGFLHRRALGHVHQHLEFALVVEWQHLQDHRAEGDQRERQHDQAEQHLEQPPAVAAARVLRAGRAS